MTKEEDVPMTTISFRIEKNAEKAFKKYCKDRYTDKSKTLYAFIHETLKENNISISE